MTDEDLEREARRISGEGYAYVEDDPANKLWRSSLESAIVALARRYAEAAAKAPQAPVQREREAHETAKAIVSEWSRKFRIWWDSALHAPGLVDIIERELRAALSHKEQP